MKKTIYLLALLLPIGAFTYNASDGANANDEDAIRATVQLYFDGMMNANPDALRTAFHPEARLIGNGSEGGIVIIPVERWADSWDGREPRDTDRYMNRIVSVDIHGTAASVKTELAWPDVHYVDYLSLLKIDGDWKIVNKIWNAEAP